MVAEGAKPPPTGSAPNPAGSAAGKAAGAGAAGGLAAWWRSVTGQGSQASSVGQRVSNVAHTVRSRASTMKFTGMPVDVKIDFLRPTLDTIKETVLNTWVQLPPQVQQAAPFVGVALGTGVLVFGVQQRRLTVARARGDELNGQVKGLKKEKEELLKRLSLLKARSGGRGSEEVSRMAAAVAEATNAAAAAADAAARAATACIFQRPGLTAPPAAA